MHLEHVDEERILVLAPKGRDAQVIEQVLTDGGVRCAVCADYQALVHELDMPAGAALIVEEALHGVDMAALADWLRQQASWSDFPFVVLVSQQIGQANSATRSMLKRLGNVVLLERPVNAETLRSAAASALRARRRQYQARSDLQERISSEERLRIALQAGRLGTWELILASGSLYASRTCKANFGRDESSPLLYDEIIASIHPDDRERRRKLVEAAIAGASDFDIEYRVIWPDGSLHWVHVQGKVSCNEQDQPTKLVGVSQDVTERREAESRLRESQEALLNLNATLESRIEKRTAELAQANDRLMREMTERERAQMALVQTQKMEALGRLTSGISHDFNNLLSVIQGNADLVNLLSTDERLKRIAATIRRTAQQGAKLTGQLLAFSRGQRLDLKAIDLNVALEGVKDLLTASLGSNIRIQFELAPGIPHVRADLNQIELAVLNLVINAKDAMRDGGTVIIRTSVLPAPDDLVTGRDYAVISIVDTGEGINQEIIAKVFDPFFTTKPLGKGTGLGLSQVYGIAQQSGGTAKIKSRVGAGTTVEIWLPFADADAAVESAPRGDIDAGLENKRACILVVEDDARVRQFIVECLEILGYEVVQADHAQAGLDKLDSVQPDLLITDFLMPGMSGAELVRQAHRKFPALPAIIATGYADMRAIDEVIDTEMVLQKPFQLNDLAYKVQHALLHSKASAQRIPERPAR
jgi:PAS domain S-box-containing protein